MVDGVLVQHTVCDYFILCARMISIMQYVAQLTSINLPGCQRRGAQAKTDERDARATSTCWCAAPREAHAISTGRNKAELRRAQAAASTKSSVSSCTVHICVHAHMWLLIIERLKVYLRVCRLFLCNFCLSDFAALVAHREQKRSRKKVHLQSM